METKCMNCGTVLTAECGDRRWGAVFVTELPDMGEDKNVVWARCNICYAAANLAQQEDRRLEHWGDTKKTQEMQDDFDAAEKVVDALYTFQDRNI